MNKFRYTLIIKESGTEIPFKTLKELSDHLNIPYHTCRGLLLSDDKLFLHNTIKELKEKYLIIKNKPQEDQPTRSL